MLSDSDSDVSDIPPELPPRTPSRTLSNAVGTTSTNGETRSSRTVSIVSTDNNLTAFINDPWNNGNCCCYFTLNILFYQCRFMNAWVRFVLPHNLYFGSPCFCTTTRTTWNPSTVGEIIHQQSLVHHPVFGILCRLHSVTLILQSSSVTTITPSITSSVFHSRLKTHLFHKSFPP